MLRISKRITLLTASLGVLAFGNVSATGSSWSPWDQTKFSGAQCQPSTGSQWPDFLVNPDGIRNINTTSNRYISCAVPWLSDQTVDQADSDSTTPAGEVNVTLTLDYSQVAAGTNWSTSCTLFGKPNDVGAAQSQTLSVQSIKTTDLKYISFIGSSALNGLNPAYFASQVSFNCRLPPLVKLTAIHVWENDSTSNYRYTP